MSVGDLITGGSRQKNESVIMNNKEFNSFIKALICLLLFAGQSDGVTKLVIVFGISYTEYGIIHLFTKMSFFYV